MCVTVLGEVGRMCKGKAKVTKREKRDAMEMFSALGW
jgi:hypothetical protein